MFMDPPPYEGPNTTPATGPPDDGRSPSSSAHEAAGEMTRLMQRWSEGDRGAFDRLIELVYDDLRRIAHRHLELGSRAGTVDTTALVHEVYIKLVAVEGGSWASRAQFFAFCSKAMRRLLIDFARRRTAEKRGGGAVRVPLPEDAGVVDAEAMRILDVEAALQELEKRDERMARVVECRFFGGMSVPETAEALETSSRTVEREWARARAYLYQALDAGHD